MRVSTSRFERGDLAAHAFLREHGFVVLRGVLSERELELVDTAWDGVVAEGAQAANLSPGEFTAQYPQNRDLWRKAPSFRALLFDSAQAEVARSFLGVSGVRLFHDHAIAKPVDESEMIPWHQDGAFWPLDRVGLSIWSPTSDVSIDGGCLEVLDGSHRDGPATPRDFLARSGEDFDSDKRLTRVPIQRGESVLLTGLTWHRSQANRARGRRLAYLTLWVPATARFRPEHASWHPTTKLVTSAPGDRLDGDWFPLFGRVSDEDDGVAVAFPAPVGADGPSMFTASRDIRRHIAWLLGDDGVEAALASPAVLDQLAQVCIARGFLREDERVLLLDVLGELNRNDEVRRRSVARDVYLRGPARWWALVGWKIAEAMAHAQR